MFMKFRFHKTYGLIFAALLAVEILIAIFVENETIRGSFGDVLVVALIYCFIQTFLNLNRLKTIVGVGVFAILIEVLQAFNFVERLNLQDNKLASTVLGTTFDMNDIWAYVAGCALIYMLEFSNENPRPKRRKLF